jgi:ribose transport system permease protein
MSEPLTIAEPDVATVRAPDAGSASSATVARYVRRRESTMTLVAALLLILFWQTATNFLTVANLADTAASLAFVAIVAIGMTYLFIAGEFDLSLGAIYGFTGMAGAWLAPQVGNLAVALVLAVAIGALIGSVNALFTTLFRIPSFIVTVGMLSVLQGNLLLVSGGFALSVPDAQKSAILTSIASGKVGSVPAQVLWAVGIGIFAGGILRFTKLGYHIYLTGGNPLAARQVGISVIGVKSFCFIFAGALAGLAGALNVAWLSSAQPSTGFGDFLFQAAGAAIIGGVALSGGEGTIYGTLVGAAILAILSNGLALTGVNPGYNIFLTGALIIGAGALDASLRGAALTRIRETLTAVREWRRTRL